MSEQRQAFHWQLHQLHVTQPGWMSQDQPPGGAGHGKERKTKSFLFQTGVKLKASDALPAPDYLAENVAQIRCGSRILVSGANRVLTPGGP